MKQTINFNQFCDSFQGDYKNSFSYEGKQALFDYLEQYKEDCDTELELDPIAFCVEYTEYKNLKELQDNYTDIESIEELQDNTTVIMIDDESFIIQDY